MYIIQKFGQKICVKQVNFELKSRSNLTYIALSLQTALH